ASFYAYDSRFTGGVRVAAGDMTGDGNADIIAGAGPTGGPHIKVFDGMTQNVVSSFLAGQEADFQGVYVAANDVDGDGQTDIVVSRNLGAGSAIQIYHRNDLAKPALVINTIGPAVPVSATDLDHDGNAEIITGSAPQQPGRVLNWRTSSGEYFTDFTPFG